MPKGIGYPKGMPKKKKKKVVKSLRSMLRMATKLRR